MKNQILFLLASLAMAMGFSSCTSEDIQNPAELNSELVNFEISLPDSELKTRGYGDGGNVSNLVCYVYQKDAQQPMQTENVSIVNNGSKRGGSLGLNLPSSGAYDFVFLATAGIQNDKSASKVYYNPTERTLNLNYSKIQGNDEDVDCFFGVLKDISVTKGGSHKVTLKRPYAQLNIGTKDLTQYNTLASAHLQTVGVSVDGVYSSMNVMNGECVGTAGAVTLPASTLPSGQTFPAKDAEYLAMDYLLVKDRKNVSVSLTGSNGKTSFTSKYENIPLQRNYQTVVYGNLLTKENDFTVAINPEFSGSGDNELETGPKEYDLIYKAQKSNYSHSLYVTDYDNKVKSYPLRKYEDSEGVGKLTWKELGISNAKKIAFNNISESNYIVSLIKCDINKIHVTDLSGILENANCLVDAPAVKDWDTSQVENMARMFYNCTHLESLDLSNFDTSNVTNMSNMFYKCFLLDHLDLSSFDTYNVTNMSSMFNDCTRLQELEISNFDTSNVKLMNNMFAGCLTLQELDVSNFDTSNVELMNNMFAGCSTLQELDVSNFNTSNVTNMASMFLRCTNVQQLDLSNFDTSNVTNMSSMFMYCDNVQELNLLSFDTSNVTNMSNMFWNCHNLKTLDLTSFNTKSLTSFSGMFQHCYAKVIWGPDGGVPSGI